MDDIINIVRELGSTGVLLVILWRLEAKWLPIFEQLKNVMVLVNDKLAKED